MPAAFERKSLHSTFAKENKSYCADLLKDFVTSGGDWSSSELSPAIRDDPVLQQQCRTRGYMIMQIGDSIRQVYCGSPTLGHSDEGASCPQCGEQFCVDHLAEHLDAKIVDPTSLQIGQPASPGENPNPYLSAPPGVDTRPGMSSWDNRELNRNELWEQKQRLTKLADLKGDREASSLVKAMWRHIRKAERERSPKWIQKNGDSGEHTMEPAQIMALDPVSRLVFEVWAYNDEYKAPASTADIAVELATRGIDQAFQDQLEQAAHTNENWLPQVLEELAAQGLIDKSPYGGWVPATRVVTKGGIGSGITGHTTPKPEPTGDIGELTIPGNSKVTVNAPGLPYHGEVGRVLYSTQPAGASERNYVLEMPDGKKVLRIGSQVTPTEPIAPSAAPTEVPKPSEPTIPGYKVGDTVFYQRDGVEQRGTITSISQGGTSGNWARVDPGTGEGHSVFATDLSHTSKVGITPRTSISDKVERQIRDMAPETHSGLSGVPRRTDPWKIEQYEAQKSGPDHISPTPGVRIPVTRIPVTKDDVNKAMSHFTPEQLKGLTVRIGDRNTAHIAKEYVSENNEKYSMHTTLPSGMVSNMQEGGLVTIMPSGGYDDHCKSSTIAIGRQSEEFYKAMDIRNSEEAIVHEVGHHYYHYNMNGSDRMDWDDLWRRERLGMREDISHYSYSSKEEGFAESMRFYKMRPEDLKSKEPRVYDFMDKMDQKYKSGAKEETPTERRRRLETPVRIV